MYDISIIIPGIRVSNWSSIYNHIDKSCTKYTWEIIFVGPYYLPEDLKNKNNIQYFQDWGCPTRCRQIAFMNMKGNYMCYGADDTFFLPETIDRAYTEILESNNYKTVLIGKYLESDTPSSDMLIDDYYKVSFHFKNLIPNLSQKISNYFIILSGFISKQLLYEIGGWDSQFQACAIAGIDLGIRLQNYGINIIIGKEPIFHATHSPGITGDHAPIHYATIEDINLLNKIYSNTNSLNRTKVNIDNWKNSPLKWEKRFK